MYVFILSTAFGERIIIPWPASPPRDFCHENVPTSNFNQSISIAKAAEVASHIVRPSREFFIQSTLGTHTPAVVPFQLNTTSPLEPKSFKLGNLP